MASPPASTPPRGSILEAKLNRKPGKAPLILFGVVLLAGCGYSGMQLAQDLVYENTQSVYPYLLLMLALLVALGFEFVNGFHDTANAVATVIYAHSLEPHVAVLWSGAWNFAGVLFSSGARRPISSVDPISRPPSTPPPVIHIVKRYGL